MPDILLDSLSKIDFNSISLTTSEEICQFALQRLDGYVPELIEKRASQLLEKVLMPLREISVQ